MTFQITRQHTAFYCKLFRGQDIVTANDLVARRQRAEPNSFVNSNPILKHPWNPTVRLCNPDNTCDALPREQLAYISHSPTKRFRAVISIGNGPYVRGNGRRT